LSVVFSIF